MQRCLNKNICDNLIIRDAKISDIKSLSKIYKKEFPIHNVFQKSNSFIINYLKEKHLANKKLGLIVVELNDEIIGGILIKKISQSLNGNHILCGYNHIVILKNISKKELD
jgi:hypothetical protein